MVERVLYMVFLVLPIAQIKHNLDLLDLSKRKFKGKDKTIKNKRILCSLGFGILIRRTMETLKIVR